MSFKKSFNIMDLSAIERKKIKKNLERIKKFQMQYHVCAFN